MLLGAVGLSGTRHGAWVFRFFPGGVGFCLRHSGGLRRYRGDGGHLASGDLGCRNMLLSSGLGSSSAWARAVWPHSHDEMQIILFESSCDFGGLIPCDRPYITKVLTLICDLRIFFAASIWGRYLAIAHASYSSTIYQH